MTLVSSSRMNLRELIATVAAALFGGALVALTIGVLIMAWDYYLMPLSSRAEHDLHFLLQAGGGLGVALGILGTSLMVIMLLYSLRKKLVRVTSLGSLAGWLFFHIICGIMGPVFIVLHAGFTWPKGLVAVAFWCMILVALSGVFGRYVYSFVPRALGGRQLVWSDALRALADLRGELVTETADARRGDLIGQAVLLVKDWDDDVLTVFDMLRLNTELRLRRTQIRHLLDEAELDPATHKKAWVKLDQQLRLKRGMEAGRVAGRLLRYWHLFHRPLAGAMYLIVALHVLSAVLFGGSLSNLKDLWM